jgi:phage portal protein BeeE
MEMLHGTWIRPAGALRGISPLEALRRAIGNAIAAEEHAGRFFGQGASLSFGVEVPARSTTRRRTHPREHGRQVRRPPNSHAIGVLTDGAKFVSGLAPTPEQAQMLATRKFAVEDLCRPYGVPAEHGWQPGARRELLCLGRHLAREFRDYAALPLATRIEAQHNRLVSVPDTITDPNASAQFKFNLDHVARTNILTRYQAHAAGVQRRLPDAARGPDQRGQAAGRPERTATGSTCSSRWSRSATSAMTKATEPLNTQPAPAGA